MRRSKLHHCAFDVEGLGLSAAAKECLTRLKEWGTSSPQYFTQSVTTARDNFKELQLLIPLLDKANSSTSSSSAAKKKNFSATEILVATSFPAASHAANCPVAKGLTTLSNIHKSEEFLNSSQLCTYCLHTQVQRVTSQHFNVVNLWCSVAPPPPPPQEGVHDMVEECGGNTDALNIEVGLTFGTYEKMMRDMTQFAINRLDGGYTWLVFNSSHPFRKKKYLEVLKGSEDHHPVRRLQFLNLPATQTPLILGLWPIACVDVTNERVADEFVQRSLLHCSSGHSSFEMGGDSTNNNNNGSAPSWSRRFRNPRAIATSILHHSSSIRNTSSGENTSLTELRTSIVQRQVESLQWVFLSKQLAAAKKYYGELEQEKEEKEETATGRVVQQESHRASQIRNHQQQSMRSYSTSVLGTANTLDDGSIVFQRELFVEYHKPDGEVVFQFKDGTTKYVKEGETLVQYPHGQVVRTFKDGKQEKWTVAQ